MSLRTGLVAYWKMDEASGNRADSVASHTMTDQSSVGSASGKINNAGDFTPASTDWMSASDHADFDFSTTFSLQAWINIDNLATDIGAVVKWDYQTDGAWGFQSGQGASDELTMFVANAADDDGSNRSNTTNANLSADTFYHIIVTYDGGLAAANRVKFYRNTTLLTTSVDGTIATSLQNAGADLRIGTWGGSLSGRYWDGLIDEVGLWNRVLTTAEMTRLYNGGNGLPFDQFSQAGFLVFM